MKNQLLIDQRRTRQTPQDILTFREQALQNPKAFLDSRLRKPKMQEVIRGFTALDADGGAFFFRELEYIKKKIFEVKYKPLSFRTLFNVTNEAGPGRKYVTIRVYDKTAPAQIITNMSDDLPAADVTARETAVPVYWTGASFRYTLGDIQASRVAGGEPLDARKAKAAFLGIETNLNKLSFYGQDANAAAASVPALFNNTYIPKSTAADGASGNTAWSTKTPDEIIFDLNNAFANVNNNSFGQFEANTIALPFQQYNYIAATPRSALSDTTILNYFLENNPFIAGPQSVVRVPELTGAATFIGGFTGNDTNNVMYVYNRDSDNVEMEIPVEYQQEAPQQRNLAFVINCWANVVGLNVYQPLSMAFVAGI